ncbi:MAG: hypothetical protein ABTQ32_24660 [Myxococcaceae bacterium]
MADDETCPRCGTFAVLESNGFRRVCGPCIPLVRHPAELANGDPIKLLGALVQVLREVGLLSLGVSLLCVTPLVLLQAFGLGRGWLPSALQLVTMSLSESVALLAFRARVLGGDPRAPIPWRAAFSRTGPVLLANLAGAVAFSVCLPAMLVFGPFMAAVGLAALEGLGPIDSFIVAWKRSSGQRVGLSIAAFVPMVPGLVIYVAPIVVTVLVAGRTAQLDGGSDRLAIVALVAFAVAFVPSNLFQIVAWLATRPQPQRVDAAS